MKRTNCPPISQEKGVKRNVPIRNVLIMNHIKRRLLLLFFVQK